MTVPLIEGRHPLIVKSLAWLDEAACQACAQALASRPGIGSALITLHGDLGAGKTTFARYLLGALGVPGRIKSPTYGVVESYQIDSSCEQTLPAVENILAIWHFDFYRFDDPQDWEDAGFRDIFASIGLKLVEWPDKAIGYLPLPDLAVHIDLQQDGSRCVKLAAYTPTGLELLL